MWIVNVGPGGFKKMSCFWQILPLKSYWYNHFLCTSPQHAWEAGDLLGSSFPTPPAPGQLPGLSSGPLVPGTCRAPSWLPVNLALLCPTQSTQPRRLLRHHHKRPPLEYNVNPGRKIPETHLTQPRSLSSDIFYFLSGREMETKARCRLFIARQPQCSCPQERQWDGRKRAELQAMLLSWLKRKGLKLGMWEVNSTTTWEERAGQVKPQCSMFPTFVSTVWKSCEDRAHGSLRSGRAHAPLSGEVKLWGPHCRGPEPYTLKPTKKIPLNPE